MHRHFALTSAQREHSEEPGPDRRTPTSGPGKDGGDDAGRRDRDVERQGACCRPATAVNGASYWLKRRRCKLAGKTRRAASDRAGTALDSARCNKAAIMAI